MLEQLTNDALPAGGAGGIAPTGTQAKDRKKRRTQPPPERSEAEERGSRALQKLLRETARRAKREDGR
jgi:hypothetical protein